MALTKQKKLTPEQLAEIKEREAKLRAYEAEVYRLPSTFALITGQRLLAKLGVGLSQEVLLMQIQQPNTYYHALLYGAAKRLIVQGHIERCRDIQAYGQQKLIHYLFSGEASKEEEDDGHETREIIEKSRVHMVEMGKSFVAFEERCSERTDKVHEALTERVRAWHRTVANVLNELIAYFKTHALNLSYDFAKNAHIQLLESAASITLTAAQIAHYCCPSDINAGIIEKTVIYFSDRDSESFKLTAEQLESMRPFFKTLDLKLKAEYDGLKGFNGSVKESALIDVEKMQEITKAFDKEIVRISQMLFKYYKSFSSDSSLQVEVTEAFEFGVDEAVADDYRALHS